jgi:hypothetical protein
MDREGVGRGMEGLRGGGREGQLVQHCLILFGLCLGMELTERLEGVPLLTF